MDSLSLFLKSAAVSGNHYVRLSVRPPFKTFPVCYVYGSLSLIICLPKIYKPDMACLTYLNEAIRVLIEFYYDQRDKTNHASHSLKYVECVKSYSLT